MLHDASFNAAVGALASMNDEMLATAAMVCKLGKVRAVEAIKIMKNPATAKNTAIEMAAMEGEVTKEMLRRLVRRDGVAPGGLTEDEAIAKVDEETQEELKELEAA